MLPPGSSRQRLAGALTTAYADGLLSQSTLVYRLERLFSSSLVDPAELIGDLCRRSPGRFWRVAVERARAVGAALRRELAQAEVPGSVLLALDWEGGCEQLLLGRSLSCDVVFTSTTVSRCHARLWFRDGGWVLQDLNSTNGTLLNGARVGRCRLRPGDHLALGEERVLID